MCLPRRQLKKCQMSSSALPRKQFHPPILWISLWNNHLISPEIRRFPPSSTLCIFFSHTHQVIDLYDFYKSGALPDKGHFGDFFENKGSQERKWTNSTKICPPCFSDRGRGLFRCGFCRLQKTQEVTAPEGRNFTAVITTAQQFFRQVDALRGILPAINGTPAIKV